MRKFLALVVLGAVLLGAGTSHAQIGVWKVVDLKVRRSGNALTGQSPQEINQGFIDSTFIYNGGLTRVDTLASIPFPGWITGNIPDSLTWLRVEAIGTQAFASGESLYVTFDGADGTAFNVLGTSASGTSMTGGFSAAGSIVPGTATSASRLFNARGDANATSSGTGTASSRVGTAGSTYGNYSGYAVLRLRIKSDSAVVPVGQLVRYRLWYQSVPGTP